MLVCEKCGAENPLGRVFCGTCGAKLDLTHMKSEDVADSQKASWVRQHIFKVVIGIVLIVVAMAGLGLWPQTDMIGEKGTRIGGRRVERKLRAMQRIRKGQSLSVDFPEKDINGYFEFLKQEKLKVDSFSVSVMEEYLAARMVRTLGKWEVGKFEIMPKISCDVVCVPSEGGGVIVSKAGIGHLPLWGPVADVVAQVVHKTVASQKEWAPFEHLAEIKMEEGKVSVLVKR